MTSNKKVTYEGSWASGKYDGFFSFFFPFSFSLPLSHHAPPDKENYVPKIATPTQVRFHSFLPPSSLLFFSSPPLFPPSFSLFLFVQVILRLGNIAVRVFLRLQMGQCIFFPFLFFLFFLFSDFPSFSYVGDWVDNKKEGKGKYTTPNGAVYEGTWHNDKRFGKGIQVCFPPSFSLFLFLFPYCFYYIRWLKLQMNQWLPPEEEPKKTRRREGIWLQWMMER